MRLRSLFSVRKHLQCQFKNRVPFSLFFSDHGGKQRGVETTLDVRSIFSPAPRSSFISPSRPPQYVASTALMLLSSWCLNDSRAFVEKYNCEPRLRLPAPSLSLLQDVVEERRGFISSMGTEAGDKEKAWLDMAVQDQNGYLFGHFGIIKWTKVSKAHCRLKKT